MSSKSLYQRLRGRATSSHGRVPLLNKLPLPAAAIILCLVLVNCAVWAAAGVVFVRFLFLEQKLIRVRRARDKADLATALSAVSHCSASCPDLTALAERVMHEKLMPEPSGLISTAVLAYTLGLRHALDADHISVRPFWSTLFSPIV